MKLTQKLLIKLISEEFDKDFVQEASEECVPKTKLREILKVWMDKEYDSDKHRWQEYGKDIQELVGDRLDEG